MPSPARPFRLRFEAVDGGRDNLVEVELDDIRVTLGRADRHRAVTERAYSSRMRFFTPSPTTFPPPLKPYPAAPSRSSRPGPQGPWHAHRRTVARGYPDRGLRPRLFLGRREGVLAAAGRRVDGRRLCRWLTRPIRPTRRCAPERTGHAEVVLVAYDPSKDPRTAACSSRSGRYHDPTQGMRQGNDAAPAIDRSSSTRTMSSRRSPRRHGDVPGAAASQGFRRDHDRDRRAPAYPFFFAEDYHQQYLDKNPGGIARIMPPACRCRTNSSSRRCSTSTDGGQTSGVARAREA